MARQWSLESGPGDVGPADYWPELAYVEEPGSIPLKWAARITARTAARWSNRYKARSLAKPGPVRQGMLPSDSLGRQGLIDDIYDWLEADVAGGERVAYTCAMTLWRDDGLVLDQWEGFPGFLRLTTDQFCELQTAWRNGGLPDDLYYASQLCRIVVEPVEVNGGVVLQRKAYSPRRWAERPAVAAESLQIPSELERRQAILKECERFREALMLRHRQLQEPGRAVDQGELDRVRRALIATESLQEYLSQSIGT